LRMMYSASPFYLSVVFRQLFSDGVFDRFIG
jgi:hypothetical protein